MRFTLTARFASGYRGKVQLRSGQLPDGISVRFPHASLAPGSSASTDVTVFITTAVSAGTYELPVIGGSGDTSRHPGTDAGGPEWPRGLTAAAVRPLNPRLRQLVGNDTSSR